MVVGTERRRLPQRNVSAGRQVAQGVMEGYEFYLLDDCRTRGFRKGNALLLPPYDEYLIGYKSRDLALASHHVSHAHTNNGIFFPVIAKDGIICGNWSPWKKALQTEYFDSGGFENSAEMNLSLEKQWANFSKMKG